MFEMISNMDANFLNLHIDKARKTSDDKQLYWQQMIITDNVLYRDIYNKFSYLVTLKVTLQLLKSPKIRMKNSCFLNYNYTFFPQLQRYLALSQPYLYMDLPRNSTNM